MNWISVKDRLPERFSAHIFWNAKENRRVITYFGKDGDLFNVVHPDCTHWLEITGPEEDFCEWSKKNDWTTTASCGLEWIYYPWPQWFNYCPNCGRVIKEVKP